MKKFKSVYELITELKPSDPVYCIRKKSIKSFKILYKKFGKVLYAVKTNPNIAVIKTLIESGIRNFDVASIKENPRYKKDRQFFRVLIHAHCKK